MKIGILTFHRADNYGALLQAYALQTTLENMGHAVDIIDYRCTPLEQDYVRLYRLCPPLRRNLLLWSCEVWRRMMNFSCLHSKKEHCDNFRNEYLHMTKSLHSDTDRALAENQYDVIFTGSDQIWSPVLTHGKDDWYAFKRQNGHCVVAAYGASVGNLDRFISTYSEYKEDLQQYNLISVREKDIQEFLQTQLNKEVSLVVDPTLLIEGEKWTTIGNTVKPIERPYVLFYGVIPCEEACEIALNVSRREKLMLVHFERNLKHVKNSYYAQGVGPAEFLNLVQNAKYVITSSFHGTVFSVLYKKKFIAVPPKSLGSRLRTILQALNLEHRIVDMDGPGDVSILTQEIDYSEAFERLNQLRVRACDYIENCIEAAKEAK